MSTSIKRVALVAVAALGLGVLSVAPSQAVAQMDTLKLSATTATQVVGDTQTATSATVTGALLGNWGDTMTLTASLVSGPEGNTKLPVLARVETSSSVVAASNLVATIQGDSSVASYATGKIAVYINAPTLAGDYVVKITPTGTGINSTAVTLTITVAKKVLGWNTAFISTTTGSAATEDTADIAVSSAAAVSAVARITVSQGYGTTKGTDTASAADSKDVVIATTKGLVSKQSLAYSDAAKSVTTAAATAATNEYYVYSNGDVGAASITVTVGGVLVATKTVTFVGAPVALVATTATGQPTYVTVSDSQTTTITGKDSAGTASLTVPSGLTVKSSDTSIATVTVSGTAVKVVGVKAGDATITVTDPATTSAAAPVTYSVHVAPATSAAAPTITFDKSAYAVGELITMTVSADMGDKAAAALFTAALKASASVQATSTVDPFASGTTTHKLVGGKTVYTFYAPAISGTFTVTGTTGSDVALTTAVVVSKTVDILNPGVDAATDAANEASAAASDATDAALAAADAADAATAAAQDAVDAVAALSTQVNKLISALKAQITTLTNLVIKIQKKVKA